jgi:septation ring formation regulator EzrA
LFNRLGDDVDNVQKAKEKLQSMASKVQDGNERFQRRILTFSSLQCNLVRLETKLQEQKMLKLKKQQAKNLIDDVQTYS